jgi:GNAT superfamily N-acetyltransferase
MSDQGLPDGVIVIPRARLDEAVAVLAAAFARDPLLTYVFAGLGERFPVALRALFRFACAVRFELDWPLLGVERAGRLAGVLGVTAVEDAPWPATLAAIYDDFQAAIGPAAAGRWERYPALADRHRPAAPNYGVGVIGVHPDYQGQGIGRRLLDAVHARSLAHPTSTGVYLDTENSASKRFYERCGYRTIAHERLDGAVDIWCLFRPNDARP